MWNHPCKFQSVGIKDMYHNAWLHWFILTESRFIGDKSLSKSVRNYSYQVIWDGKIHSLRNFTILSYKSHSALKDIESNLSTNICTFLLPMYGCSMSTCFIYLLPRLSRYAGIYPLELWSEINPFFLKLLTSHVLSK